PRADRPGEPPPLGLPPVQEVPVPERLSPGRRRPRAQELYPADVEPPAGGAPRAFPPLAGVRQPRGLPRLQREAAAPGRARAVRLRAPAEDERPVGRRGAHELLRRADRRPRRPGEAGGLPDVAVGARRPTPERPGAARADAGAIVARRVDRR